MFYPPPSSFSLSTFRFVFRYQKPGCELRRTANDGCELRRTANDGCELRRTVNDGGGRGLRRKLAHDLRCKLGRGLRGAALLTAVMFGAAAGQGAAAQSVYQSDFSASGNNWRLQVPGSQRVNNCEMTVLPKAGRTGNDVLKTSAKKFGSYQVYLPTAINVKGGERYRVSVWSRVEEDTEVQRPGPGPFLRITFGAAQRNQKITPQKHLFVTSKGNVSPMFLKDGKPSELEALDFWFDLARRTTRALNKDRVLQTQWTQTSAVVEAPEGADRMELSLILYRVKGAVLWDDVQVQRVSKSTPLSPFVGEFEGGHFFDWNKISDAQMFEKLDLSAAGLSEVRKKVEAGDYEGAKAAYLTYRREESPVKWRTTPMPAPTTAGTQTDPRADEICAHVMRNSRYAISVSEAFMGEDFDWEYNPVPANDPNHTKEWSWCVVSRMGFWNVLASTYRRTSNEKYAQKWTWFIRDFAADNPVGNTADSPGATYMWRTIDTGIRMNNSWPNAYFTFLNSPSFTPEDNWLFLKLVYASALRLKDGLLEYPERTGNWVNLECNGLFNAGTLFPEFKEAQQWRDIAVDRLVTEMNLVLTPEGMQAEFSPSYHYGALGGWRNVLNLATLNGLTVPEVFRERLVDMYRAPVLIMDQSGEPVATNDSTTVDARKMAQRGLEISSDPVLAWAASGGREGTPLPASTAIEYAGLYAMRGGWEPEDLYLFFRGGPVGVGHAEQDMLQVVLKAWGKALLIDSGRYNYDKSQWRRYAINTPAHNTIIVDGKWQNREKTELPVNRPLGNPWVRTGLFDYVAATYDEGYQRNEYVVRQYRPQRWVGEKDFSVSHTRRVLFLRPWYALVLDSLDGTGTHTFDAHFHIDAPAARIDPRTQAAFSERTDEVQVALYPLAREHLEAEIVQGQSEPMLGWIPSEQRAIPTVRFRKKQEAPAVFATFLYPYRGEQPEFSATALKLAAGGQGGQAFAVQTAKEDAEVAVIGMGKAPVEFQLESRLLGAIGANGSGLVLRRLKGQEQVFVGGWNLRAYQDAQTQFALSEPATLMFARSAGEEKLLVFLYGESAVRIWLNKPFAAEYKLQPGQWFALLADGRIEAIEAPASFSSF